MPFQWTTSAGENLTASFLQVADTRNSPFSYDVSRAVAGCGYAPRLASTAANLSSPASSLASAMLGTIWSWHTLQPINSTVHNCALASLSLASRSAPVHSDAPDFKLPDTNMSTTSAPNTGPRWVAARCLDIYYTACQSMTDPHVWTLSPTRYAWPEAAAPAPTAGRACPDGFTFAVPRTPLQNWMLGRAMATKGVDAAWVYFSDASTDGCWVVGSAKCAYSGPDAEQVQQIIAVSLGAGLIVLIVVAVFVWVKCRRYLRVSKMARRQSMVKKRLAELEEVTVPVYAFDAFDAVEISLN
ncbi:hypothetical protein AMAG_11239 [Allomyces macrogynus ATCC 38327]|uniref:Uncharacterized protein n=1 Tax=Allomyces macrogynus (strain ATCC 38327) TaxID=578462 RepID=A0A0L0SW50_ALLM3|nr:hypothetical protein AMAG_11239 [Allomyces macrogynus ATCC 38327]|eukprot:KNE66742.1 hypothetical protein AMAG_11239 [Allomyces macrogynus ATCC 38327]